MEVLQVVQVLKMELTPGEEREHTSLFPCCRFCVFFVSDVFFVCDALFVCAKYSNRHKLKGVHKIIKGVI